MKFLSKLTLFLALALVASGAHAQTVVTGTTEGGAFYRIVVPPNWNGDLVIWNHGFDLNPPAPNPDLGPLANLQLAQGYAVAASSYQQAGWALFKTKNDLQNLVNAFQTHFGPPRFIFVTGASLGGIVTAQAIEEANIGNVIGALSLCGAVAGSRNWDGALDLRLVYDAVCSQVPGAAIPGGAEGLPPGFAFTIPQMAGAVNACTGVLLPPILRTPQQQANLTKILMVTKIPENFLITDMVFATFALSDLVHDPRKLAGKLPSRNDNVDYNDPTINATIARVTPNPGAANRLGKRFLPAGAVGSTKIVALHTDKDGLVVVENESEYASVVPPGNLTTAIVVEAMPTHCGFTGGEVVASWEALRGWAYGGPQPSPATIQGICLAVAPAVGGPCRINPAFVIPDLDTRIRPR
jgi:hypothetical protein